MDAHVAGGEREVCVRGRLALTGVQVRTALLIAELGLQLAKVRGELAGDVSNKVNSALDWMEARGAAGSGRGAGVFDGTLGTGECALDGKMVKFAIHTYRAKLALIQGSKNACKREMKGAQGACVRVVPRPADDALQTCWTRAGPARRSVQWG